MELNDIIDVGGSIDVRLIDAGGAVVHSRVEQTSYPSGPILGVVAHAPDAKLIGAEGQWSSEGIASASVERLNADLTPDTTFGVNGATSFDPTQLSGVSAIAVAPDGSVYLARGYDEPSTVARLDPDGTLDTSFGVGGFLTDLPDNANIITQPDGKLLIVAPLNTTLVLTRYNPDGTLDPSFGSAGRSTIDLGQRLPTSAVSVAMQPVGSSERLLVGGTLLTAATSTESGQGPSEGFVARIDL